MNGDLKKQLKQAFNAPAPTGRDVFLAAADFPRAGRAGFLLAQMGYIRKRVWAASLLAGLISAAALWLPSGLAPNGLTNGLLSNELAPNSQIQGFMWAISSFLPLVALVGILEMARSASHNMDELEASCKYSLSHIVLARLCVLGAVNALMLFAVAVLFENAMGYGFLRICVYISLPFLLTCSLSLYALNRLRPSDGVYAGAVISVLVGAAQGLGVVNFKAVYINGNTMLWAAAGMGMLIWLLMEIKAFLKRINNMESSAARG